MEAKTETLIERAERLGLGSANLSDMLDRVERLEAQLEQAIDPKLTGIQMHEGMISMGVKGSAAQVFAATFAAQFKEVGAINFIEIEFDAPDVGPLLVTMQRKQGKTPNAMRLEAEEKSKDLLAALQAIVKFNRGHLTAVNFGDLLANADRAIAKATGAAS